MIKLRITDELVKAAGDALWHSEYEVLAQSSAGGCEDMARTVLMAAAEFLEQRQPDRHGVE